jgi:hypothetical protein
MPQSTTRRAVLLGAVSRRPGGQYVSTESVHRSSADYQAVLAAQEKAAKLVQALTTIVDAHPTQFWRQLAGNAQGISSKLNELVDHIDERIKTSLNYA